MLVVGEEDLRLGLVGGRVVGDLQRPERPVLVTRADLRARDERRVRGHERGGLVDPLLVGVVAAVGRRERASLRSAGRGRRGRRGRREMRGHAVGQAAQPAQVRRRRGHEHRGMVGFDDRRPARRDGRAVQRREHAADLVGADHRLGAGGRGGRSDDAEPDQRENQPTHRRRTVHRPRRPVDRTCRLGRDVRVALLMPALHIACRDGRRGPRTIGLAGAWVLLGFALLTGFTIGMFVQPGAVALTAAAVMTPIRAASCTPSSDRRRRGTSWR